VHGFPEQSSAWNPGLHSQLVPPEQVELSGQVPMPQATVKSLAPQVPRAPASTPGLRPTRPPEAKHWYTDEAADPVLADEPLAPCDPLPPSEPVPEPEAAIEPDDEEPESEDEPHAQASKVLPPGAHVCTPVTFPGHAQLTVCPGTQVDAELPGATLVHPTSHTPSIGQNRATSAKVRTRDIPSNATRGKAAVAIAICNSRLYAP
jgi:hypothetical protein